MVSLLLLGLASDESNKEIFIPFLFHPAPFFAPAWLVLPDIEIAPDKGVGAKDYDYYYYYYWYYQLLLFF